MDFEREKPDCKFSIPDRPTVRRQLEYISRAAGWDGEEMLLRYWLGAVALIDKWECKILPDYKVDLDKLTDPQQTTVIIWAGIQVRDFMNGLEEVPKNE